MDAPKRVHYQKKYPQSYLEECRGTLARLSGLTRRSLDSARRFAEHLPREFFAIFEPQTTIDRNSTRALKKVKNINLYQIASIRVS